MYVDVNFSRGGRRCRCSLDWVVLWFGGSNVCVEEGRCLNTVGDRFRESHVLFVSHAVPLPLLVSCLRLYCVSLVLSVRVLDLLVWLLRWRDVDAVTAWIEDELGVSLRRWNLRESVESLKARSVTVAWRLVTLVSVFEAKGWIDVLSVRIGVFATASSRDSCAIVVAVLSLSVSILKSFFIERHIMGVSVAAVETHLIINSFQICTARVDSVIRRSLIWV